MQHRILFAIRGCDGSARARAVALNFYNRESKLPSKEMPELDHNAINIQVPYSWFNSISVYSRGAIRSKEPRD